MESQWILGRVVALTLFAFSVQLMAQKSQWILGRVVALTNHHRPYTDHRRRLNGSSAESSR